MRWSKSSHIGLVRQTNEDNGLVCEDLSLLAVADGMGGHRAGEVASRTALDTMAEYVRLNSSDIAAGPIGVLKRALEAANDKIFRQSQRDPDYHGMGTTITAVLMAGEIMYLAHVGDSRAYIIHDGAIRLVTDDHSLVNELVKNGGITRDEATRHPHRNVLTRAIGSASEVNIDFYEEPLSRGDILMLCTDGLSNLLSLDEMRETVTMALTPEAGTEKLVNQALERGGPDNITVILCKIE
jgi:serine/threonine protein phosphatase PrpC